MRSREADAAACGSGLPGTVIEESLPLELKRGGTRMKTCAKNAFLLPTRTGSPSASFSFSTEAEDWEHFECNLGGAGFLPCPNPFSREGLGAGNHTFEVRAVDTLGNTEGTPAKHTWMVQRSHYGMNCTASGSSAWTGWVGGLLLIGLLRRRR